MSTIMISLKQRMMFVKILTFIMMVIIMGLTACSRQASNTTDSESSSSKVETAENEQDPAKETLEVQPTNSPTPYVSRIAVATEEVQVVWGKCGKDAEWSYDTGSKILYIEGKGIVDQKIKKTKGYVSDEGKKLEYSIKEIRIGEGITALDCGSLFQNIIKEEDAEEIKIILPDSLKKIGVGTFSQNDAEYIRHIHLPRKLRYIEGGAFWGIGDGAYPQAYSYKEDVENISNRYKKKLEITVDNKNPYYIVKNGVLFTKDAKKLVYYPPEKTDKVYRIPKSVTRIEPLAFAGNSFLKEVVLPKGLKVIGAGAFFNDHRLAKINLEQAKKLKRIYDFNGWSDKISGWTGVPEGQAEEVLYGDDEHYDDPAEDEKYKKDSYSLGTFAGTNLKSIQFPDDLQYVSYNTFKNCYHLKKISIGESYAGEINPDRIGDKKGFFLPDGSAKEIRVSERNRHYKVRNHILYSKDGKTVYKVLKSYCDSTLVLDKNVRKIASKAFSGAGKPRKVVALGNLKQISREAFAVSSIKSFEAYGDVDTIGIDAFFMCYSLQKFICHGTVKHVGAQAFYYAANLGELSLGKNIESIGTCAFEGCSGFKKPRVKKK
ncbi:MAG: leucine-rich repeat domain-containing protein [Lachnospiraceae bacterium]|nr:leucine-rich repeat domain-containing protein [Lachnospiraceae bacterium]